MACAARARAPRGVSPHRHSPLNTFPTLLALRQVAEIIRNLDVDQNGQIEWGEFATLMADRWLRQDGETDMELAANLFTVAGDESMLDVAKMRELLTTLGESPEPEGHGPDRSRRPEGKRAVSLETFRSLPCWQVPTNWRISSARGAAPRGGGSGQQRRRWCWRGAAAAQTRPRAAAPPPRMRSRKRGEGDGEDIASCSSIPTKHPPEEDAILTETGGPRVPIRTGATAARRIELLLSGQVVGRGAAQRREASGGSRQRRRPFVRPGLGRARWRGEAGRAGCLVRIGMGRVRPHAVVLPHAWGGLRAQPGDAVLHPWEEEAPANGKGYRTS